jgi:hypothetical protein
VPSNRLFAYQAPIAGGGEMTLVRDKGMTGGACYVGVFVGGELVAKVAGDAGPTAIALRTNATLNISLLLCCICIPGHRSFAGALKVSASCGGR